MPGKRKAMNKGSVSPAPRNLYAISEDVSEHGTAGAAGEEERGEAPPPGVQQHAAHHHPVFSAILKEKLSSRRSTQRGHKTWIECYRPEAGVKESGVVWGKIITAPMVCDPALEPLIQVDYLRLERFNLPFGMPNIRLDHFGRMSNEVSYGFYIRDRCGRLLYKAETVVLHGHATNRRQAIVLKNYTERDVIRFTCPLDDHNYQMKMCPFCCLGWCRCYRETLFCQRKVFIECPPGHRVSKVLPAPDFLDPCWMLMQSHRKDSLKVKTRSRRICRYSTNEVIGYYKITVEPGNLMDKFEMFFPKDLEPKVKLQLLAMLFIVDHYNPEQEFVEEEDTLAKMTTTFNTQDATSLVI